MQTPLSVVVGWTVPYRRTPLANVAIGWPFGRANASDDRLVLTVRGPLGRRWPFGKNAVRTLEPGAITQVTRMGQGPLHSLRIRHTTDDVGRLTVDRKSVV